MLPPIALSVCLAGLLIGSYTDLRTREVPDWINYALIFCGFGLATLNSLTYWKASYIFSTLIGFGVFWVIAVVMYYTGQWGGGDSKMIMGIGALIGLSIPSIMELATELPFLVSFILYSMVLGAVYGISWTVVLALRNRKRWLVEYSRLCNSPRVRRVRRIVLGSALALLILSFLVPAPLRPMLLILSVISVMTVYLFLFVKTVEKTSMLKHIEPSKLTVGDWIAEEVRVKGVLICGPKDLGIEKHQIEKLIALARQGKVDRVLVKEGIPFVPSFLFAFLASMFLGSAPFYFFL
jgi:Flp pilus assembly protein protease CpaA